jgi:hypothetical protein
MKRKKPSTYWVKLLSDGTEELGTPEDIELGKASWTKGRSDIVSTLLVYGGTSITLKADTNCPFFQFDNFVSTQGPSAMVSRDIGCLIPRKMGYRVSVSVDGKKPYVTVSPRGDRSLPNGTRGITCSLSFDGEITVKYF